MYVNVSRGDEMPVEPRGVSSPGTGAAGSCEPPDLGCSGRAGHLLNSCFVSPDPLRIFYFTVLFYLYVCVMYSV